MKCEFCNGNLSLENAFCPHCGKPNKHAQQHVKDMESYAGRYDKTEQEVYATARRYSDTVVRAVIVAILAVVFIVVLVVYNRIDDIYYSAVETNNELNFSTHSAKMNQYLEAEDYLGFYYYCSREDIYGSDNGYEDYDCLINVIGCYTDAYELLMVKACDSEENAEYSFNAEHLGSTLGRFYHYQNSTYHDVSQEGSQMTEECLEKINRDMEYLLETYCNVPVERMGELAEMSDAQRTLFLEECIANEE